MVENKTKKAAPKKTEKAAKVVKSAKAKVATKAVSKVTTKTMSAPKKSTPKAKAKVAAVQVEVVQASAEEKANTRPNQAPKVTRTSSGPTSYAELNRLHKGALASLKGSVVLTSSQQGEGTSLMAYLMAQKSAEAGNRVLLVDLNMKNHYLTHKLGMERGAWNLLARAEGDDLMDLVADVKTVEGLFFMKAPADLESVLFLKDGIRARVFLNTLEMHFDHVIVDTTPVGLLNRGNVDPVLLASVATRTILVMLAGVTSSLVIQRAVAQLKSAGASVEGVIVNDRDNPSLRKQLLSFVNGLKRFAPGFSDWLRYRILHNESLD